ACTAGAGSPAWATRTSRGRPRCAAGRVGEVGSSWSLLGARGGRVGKDAGEDRLDGRGERAPAGRGGVQMRRAGLGRDVVLARGAGRRGGEPRGDGPLAL